MRSVIPVFFAVVTAHAIPLHAPRPSPRPVVTRDEEQAAWVFIAAPFDEVLRFMPDGSIYLRGRLVGQDPAIARIMKQQERARQ